MNRAATDILIEGLERAFRSAASKYPSIFKVAALGYGQGGLPAVTAYVDPKALKNRHMGMNDITARTHLTLQARTFGSSGTKAILNFGGLLMERQSPLSSNPFTPIGDGLAQIESLSEDSRESIHYGTRAILLDEIDIEALTANLEAVPEKLQAQCDSIFKAWHDGIQDYITSESTPGEP